MIENKVLLDQLKGFVEKGITLQDNDVQQLQEKFGKSAELITNMYQLLVEKQHTLAMVEDAEADVYSTLITREMKRGKTFYGAAVWVAELFELPQTYVKYKVKRYIHVQMPRIA